MLRFFDFLFLRIYKFYDSFNEKGAQSSAAGAVGFFMAANILTALMLLSSIFNVNVFISNKLYILVIAIFFQVIFHIRYVSQDTKNLPLIKEKWGKLTENQKNYQRYYALAYMIASAMGLIILTIL